MKMIIMAAVGLLVLIGVAFGGMAVFKVGPFKQTPEQEAAAAAAPVAPAKPSLIRMETLPIPIIDNRELQRRIDLMIKLEVDPDRKDKIYAMMPRLQNAFISDMLAFMPLHMRNRQNPDADAIRLRLAKVADKILGAGSVKGIQLDVVSR